MQQWRGGKVIPHGFTLIEVLIVVAIIGILARYVLPSIKNGLDKAYVARAATELHSINESLEMYKNDHGGNFPPDADRDIPPGLEQYLAPGVWPDAAWPGSVFDWENWIDPISGERIYQISIRFCPVNQPAQCRFPGSDWAQDFDYFSSVYYCISGACRSHINKPLNHPGHCINCGD
ncbi:MAG: type II secretion system protein [Candidatus Paceibacterota bacterium]